MTKSLSEARWMPHGRQAGCPYHPPAGLVELRETEPLSRIHYAGGHEGWLVTSHALARAVLADPRFSVRSEVLRSPVEGGPVVEDPPPAPPGFITNIDPPEHSRYRRQIMGRFTVRRMRLLTERVEEITKSLLDRMEHHGPPADLVTSFARPLPGLVVGELFGVRPEDREKFYDALESLHRLRQAEASAEEMTAAFIELRTFVADIVLGKRENPTDDLFSELTDSDFTDEEFVNVALALLGAGTDSVASTLSLGTLALLQNRDQFAALVEEPELAERAVEELLRYTTAFPLSIRAAKEDLELDGHLVKAGENVTISTATANRDPARFPDPDRLDLARTDRGHVAFGHGVHQCVAQQLARVELKVAFPALATRFPTLKLTVAPEDVPVRDEIAFYGLHELPVTW